MMDGATEEWNDGHAPVSKGTNAIRTVKHQIADIIADALIVGGREP